MLPWYGYFDRQTLPRGQTRQRPAAPGRGRRYPKTNKYDAYRARISAGFGQQRQFSCAVLDGYRKFEYLCNPVPVVQWIEFQIPVLKIGVRIPSGTLILTSKRDR